MSSDNDISARKTFHGLSCPSVPAAAAAAPTPKRYSCESYAMTFHWGKLTSRAQSNVDLLAEK